MSDLKTDDGKQAIYCLEHLLYEIPFSALHNIAALLAQETGRPVDEFGDSMGHWSFEVVERFLWDRGMKCVPTTHNDTWTLDMSPNFLRRDHGFVGFIIPQTMQSFKWSGEVWTNSQKEDVEDINSQLTNEAVVVYRMWAPVQSYYKDNKAFHITLDEWKWERNEHRPGSCWRSELVSYHEGRSRAVKSYMRYHKEEPIMMSSSKEIVLCSPTPKGWQTETLTNYECLTINQASARVLETLMQKLQTVLDEDKACVIMSHVAYSVLTYMGGRLTPQDCSALTPDELELLQQYEMGLKQVVDAK